MSTRSSNLAFLPDVILSKITGNDQYDKIASLMIRQVEDSMPGYPAAYANWLGLVLQKAFPFFEICIIGLEENSFIII